MSGRTKAPAAQIPTTVAIESRTAEPELAKSEVGPEWLRALDTKSLAAMPSAGGAMVMAAFQDVCADVVPLLRGSDAVFVEAALPSVKASLEALESGLSAALASVKAGEAVAACGLAQAMTDVAAASAECALRVLMAEGAGRSKDDLRPLADALESIRQLHFEGPGAQLVRELAGARLAPEASAVATLLGYVAFVPLGANARHQGWIGKRLADSDWAWYELAVVPLTLAATVSRSLAAGVPMRGRFSVSLAATRGRTS